MAEATATCIPPKRALTETYQENDHDAGESEGPPRKKQKRSNETASAATNINPKIVDSSNKAFILLPGCTSRETLDHLCEMLNANSFEITEQKRLQMNTDQFEHLFIECDDTSIHTFDMISTGMYGVFCNSGSLCVILISNHTNDIYKELKVFSKTYDKQNEHQQHIYFTLNHSDYRYKYEILYAEKDQHSLFWQQMHEKNEAFIGSNHNTENERNLNCFYDETQRTLEIERESQHIQCCCIPIALYLNPKHSARYLQKIISDGLNTLARQWYRQSMERSCNIYSGLNHYVSIEGSIMDAIWEYLGVVIYGNDKQNIKSYECKHCDTPITSYILSTQLGVH